MRIVLNEIDIMEIIADHFGDILEKPVEVQHNKVGGLVVTVVVEVFRFFGHYFFKVSVNNNVAHSYYTHRNLPIVMVPTD